MSMKRTWAISSSISFFTSAAMREDDFKRGSVSWMIYVAEDITAPKSHFYPRKVVPARSRQNCHGGAVFGAKVFTDLEFEYFWRAGGYASRSRLLSGFAYGISI